MGILAKRHLTLIFDWEIIEEIWGWPLPSHSHLTPSPKGNLFNQTYHLVKKKLKIYACKALMRFVANSEFQSTLFIVSYLAKPYINIIKRILVLKLLIF